MSWFEITPGHWRRQIGENESMIQMIGDGGRKHGKDTWSIFATAQFTAQLGAESLVEALQDGWRALRFRHPSIATTATGDSIDYYVPNAKDLGEWVNESFIVSDAGTDLDQLVANLAPRRYPTCYYLPKPGTVLLHISHWRTDGIGAFHLLNALFAEAIVLLREDPPKLSWGDEVTRLVPSVEEGLGLAITPTEAVERATNNYMKTLGHSLGALDIPLQPGREAAATNGTMFVDFTFPKKQTARIQSTCRQLDIKLDSAIHASVAAAAYVIAEPAAKDKHHCSTLRHSLRPHLPDPFNGAPGAAGLYTGGYMVRVPSSNLWLENAKYYESEYRRGATPDLLCSRRQYARLMKDILANMPPANPPPSGLDVSIIPNAQDLVCVTHSNDSGQYFQVQNVGVGVEVLSRHMYVFAWVLDGQLGLRLVCNKGFYDGMYATKVLELVREQLVSNSC